MTKKHLAVIKSILVGLEGCEKYTDKEDSGYVGVYNS